MSRNLKVKVWRGKEVGGFMTYEVPRHESQTVLDVVTFIQRSETSDRKRAVRRSGSYLVG